MICTITDVCVCNRCSKNHDQISEFYTYITMPDEITWSKFHTYFSMLVDTKYNYCTEGKKQMVRAFFVFLDTYYNDIYDMSIKVRFSTKTSVRHMLITFLKKAKKFHNDKEDSEIGEFEHFLYTWRKLDNFDNRVLAKF